MSKTFQLTLSPDYVKDWTAQDGIREFIQNSLDQESVEENNKSYVKASDGCLIIENNNSILKHSTLLLGGGNKADNKELIGGFGEGYKIALLVLIRLGFKVHIANYGLGELWEPEISYSHEFGTDILKIICKPLKHGANIERGVSVIITKAQFDFVKVLNIVSLEYRSPIVISENTSYGQILDPETEKGNLYIGGLFISNCKELVYGYNFKPGVIKIGRDRNITNTFDVQYYAGNYLFKHLLPEYIDQFIEHLNNKVLDVEYVDRYSLPDTAKVKLQETYANKTVISSESDKQVLTDNGIKASTAIVVPKVVKDLIWASGFSGSSTPIVRKTLKDLLGEFLEREKDTLSTEHYEELSSLLKRKQ